MPDTGRSGWKGVGVSSPAVRGTPSLRFGWKQIQPTRPVGCLQRVAQDPGVKLEDHLVGVFESGILDRQADKRKSRSVVPKGSLIVGLLRQLTWVFISLPCCDSFIGEHPRYP